MITNSRLIATIRGWAEAGNQHQHVLLTSRPQVVRTLLQTSCAVGAAGVLVAGFGQIQAGLLTSAASAAASAGNGFTSGGSQVAEVEPLAAPDAPVEVAVIETAAPPVTTPPVTAPPPPAEPVRIQRIAAVATTPPAPVEPGSVEAVITEVFGEHAQSAIGVARCESGLRPEAISRGGGNYGLFQINTVHRQRVANMGYAWEQLLDARVNALVAKSIFDEQGWRPWACRHAV